MEEKCVVESHIRTVATKELIRSVSKELDIQDPENTEDVLGENEIKDESK